jgi:hypothetical protein
MFQKPVYAFTVTYQKKGNRTEPVMTVYVDGPFVADASLKNKEAQEKLRNQVFSSMKERSLNSTYQYATYIKKEKTE